MIIVTKVAAAPHLLRYQFDYDGAAAPETVVIPNSQILSDCVAGPLRSKFNVSGLTTSQAMERLIKAADMSLDENCLTVFPGGCTSVDVDGEGKPTITCTFVVKDNQIILLGSFQFRHTLIR